MIKKLKEVGGVRTQVKKGRGSGGNDQESTSCNKEIEAENAKIQREKRGRPTSACF